MQNSMEKIPIPSEALGLNPNHEEEARLPQYSLVIFDFHGTLTDHQLRAVKAYHNAGHDALGTHFPKEFYQKALARPSMNSGEAQTNRAFIQNELSEFESGEFESYWEAYKQYMDTVYIPIPGVKRVLQGLSERGVDMSVLTNGKNREIIQNELVKWGFPDLAARLYSSHVTGVKKPDSRTVEHIIEDYASRGTDVQKSKILLIGDYTDDIHTAHNVGIDSALMVRGNGWETMKIKEPQPSFVVTDPLEILRIVDGQVPKFAGTTYQIQPLLWKNEAWGPVQNSQSVEITQEESLLI